MRHPVIDGDRRLRREGEFASLPVTVTATSPAVNVRI
jgi:hypothetical protein